MDVVLEQRNAIAALARKSSRRASLPAVSAPEPEATSHLFVPILKAEEQLLYGVVLKPETVDAQGDIYSADVIKEAAHKFLAAYNERTKLGRQHKTFTKGQFALVESYIAPSDLVINGKTVIAGSWLMVMKVLDSKIWKAVKDGKITGFSIGGRAKAQKLR